jgi:hypothetical protein
MLRLSFPRRVCVAAALTFFSSANAFAIVGGSDSRSSNGARRYTVGLLTKSNEVCTGVVIAQDLILTAAHCLGKSKPKLIMALSPDFRPRSFPIATYWRNPTFIPGKRPLKQKGADLALIALAAPLPADMVPIDIASSVNTLTQTTSLNIAGFGVTRYGEAQTAGLLREASLTPIGVGKLGVVSLIASDDGKIGMSRISACLGDSGGPVTVRERGEDVLVGIISWVGSQHGSRICEGVTVATPTLLSDKDARESLTQGRGSAPAKNRNTSAYSTPSLPDPAGTK